MKMKFLTVFVIVGLFSALVQAQSNNRSNAYYEEMIGNMSNQLRLLQDENAKLSGTVYTLQQELREMKRQMQVMRAEITQNRRMVTEESSARQKQLNGIADKVQRAAEAQNRAAEAQRAAMTPPPQKENPAGNQSGQTPEEYDIYVVQAGANLTAISRATGISIARLKQVNGLKNDVIWVGQKLKIPKK